MQYLHSLDSPTPFSKGTGVNFSYLPPRGGIWKIKKKSGSMVQGYVFLKMEGGWGGGLKLFLFNFLQVYHTYI